MRLPLDVEHWRQRKIEGVRWACLHAVEEGWGYGVEEVGGAHEEDLGEVNGHVQIVVQETRILLWVQQL